jgi:hypothetical protein
LLGFRVVLEWTDCDSVWLICINFGFCMEKYLLGFRVASVLTDCDSEGLICINGMF